MHHLIANACSCQQLNNLCYVAACLSTLLRCRNGIELGAGYEEIKASVGLA